jgi:hypothetical protein
VQVPPAVVEVTAPATVMEPCDGRNRVEKMRDYGPFLGLGKKFVFLLLFDMGMVKREVHWKLPCVGYTITQKVKSELSIGKGEARRSGFHLACDTPRRSTTT